MKEVSCSTHIIPIILWNKAIIGWGWTWYHDLSKLKNLPDPPIKRCNMPIISYWHFTLRDKTLCDPAPLKSSNPHPPVINNERSHIFFSCFFLVARWLCKQSLLHTSTSPSTTNSSSSSSSSTLALVQKIHLLCVCCTNSPSLTKCYLGK